MIITNFIADLIILVVRKWMPLTNGIAIWPFIFISPKHCRHNTRLILHEKKHLEQWERYWIVGFLFVYIYQYIKYGYDNMPLEIEAVKASGL